MEFEWGWTVIFQTDSRIPYSILNRRHSLSDVKTKCTGFLRGTHRATSEKGIKLSIGIRQMKTRDESQSAKVKVKVQIGANNI